MNTDKDYEKGVKQKAHLARLRLQIKNQENKITDMNVVIETLQQALDRAKVTLEDNLCTRDDKDYVFNHSARWAIGWSLKDYDYNI